jgi:hypothetical protein
MNTRVYLKETEKYLVQEKLKTADYVEVVFPNGECERYTKFSPFGIVSYTTLSHAELEDMYK